MNHKWVRSFTEEQKRFLEVLIKWRSSMADGRVKPNKYGEGIFRDSLESIGNIARIDKILEELLLPSWDEFNLKPSVMAFGKNK